MSYVPYEEFVIKADLDGFHRQVTVIGQADMQSMDLVRAFKVPEEEQEAAAIRTDGILTAIQRIMDLSVSDPVWAKGDISLWYKSGDPVIDDVTGEQFTMGQKVS
ncbi:MAG: hypothetical protein E4G90_09870 [Gemmatimonadales bacterium]|nr:MAG: hypothetical protein E4G90_09870 [Gemmatimonadales bacterium]